MFNPLISIVIPIYNRENTLHYCIDSIVNQNYKNWELLLVDDGSKDNSADICKKYTILDKRIKYIYQQNQGAGPARNNGIENASGDWITFIDSDDAIMPNHLDQLIEHGVDCDMVMVNRCKASYIDGKLTLINQNQTTGLESRRFSGNRNIIEYLYTGHQPYKHANFACWDKFFKMSVIKENNVKYPIDVPTGQDQVFVVSYFKHTEEFFFSNIGTYAPTPMGNEGIDHLACRLRHPKEFLHCQKVNYMTLMELAEQTELRCVYDYAVNYILTKPLERAVIPYTHWRNRRQLSREKILEFLNEEYMPILLSLKNDILVINNPEFREYAQIILEGQATRLYDSWFWKNLKNDIVCAVNRRIRRLI